MICYWYALTEIYKTPPPGDGWVVIGIFCLLLGIGGMLLGANYIDIYGLWH